MSSALTGNKIKDSYQALLKMGTNGSLDPIVPISITDGLGNDTPLLLSATLFKTQVVSANKDYGLQLDLSTNSHVYLGDYNTQYNGTSLYLSDFNQLIQTYGLGNQSIGLKLDFANNFYSLGDTDGVSNNNCINIDNAGNSINLISQSSGTFLGKQNVVLESQNKQFLTNDGFNQLIYTGNDNGTYSGDRGIKLDFANNIYEFGDRSNTTSKAAFLSLVSDPNEASAAISIFGNALNIREYGNIWGGAQGNINYFDAIYDNFGFNFDWTIDNNDIGQFPFYKNTIINTFGNVITTEIAMNNSFFANNSQLELNTGVNLSNNEVLSNCFVFGLTTMVDTNNIRIFSKHAGTYNTNVVILNGSGLKIGKGGNHIFSVNASGLDFKDDDSGITVLGGDVYDESSGIYVIAQHSLNSNKYGINFTGHHAVGTNNLSNVFGYYNAAYSTGVGQVQIEQKQLFANCPDGYSYYNLVDTFEDPKIYVETNTTYLVDAKFVSTNGNGSAGNSGNWTLYRQYIICVDGGGSLDIIDKDINAFNFTGGNQDVKLQKNTNEFYFEVLSDNASGQHCWVRAEIVLHKIKAV